MRVLLEEKTKQMLCERRNHEFFFARGTLLRLLNNRHCFDIIYGLRFFPSSKKRNFLIFSQFHLAVHFNSRSKSPVNHIRKIKETLSESSEFPMKYCAVDSRRCHFSVSERHCRTSQSEIKLFHPSTPDSI